MNVARGLTLPDFVYKFKKIIAIQISLIFSSELLTAGYILDIMRQTACLILNPFMVESYAALFSCTAVVKTSNSMKALNTWLKLDDIRHGGLTSGFLLTMARSVGI